MDKRRAVLDAAIAEFGVAGFRDASMDAIARAAGVSKVTIYRHFPTKEALFAHLVEELGRRISVREGIEYHRGDSLRSQLLRAAHSSAALVRNPGTLALFRTIVAEHVRRPALVERVLARYWKEEYGFVRWVEQACVDGRLRAKSPQVAAHHFESLIKGVLVWPAVFERRIGTAAEVQSSVAEAVDLFLAYYAPRPRAAAGSPRRVAGVEHSTRGTGSIPHRIKR
ncbi:MAG: TetR/AcrR family transcriptional regulator [Burkholderiales bacterium]|nr:TetR/AcrR family transcriptional regulator [Burkholderiales bacterium]